MSAHESALQTIYVSMIGEAVVRLDSAEEFLALYSDNEKLPFLDAAILQLRKALELIAIAAIAPDKVAYENLRASNTKDADFTKDYHAAKIFDVLSRVNPDFYPMALAPAELQSDGSWHFNKREGNFLTKKRFERAYDRLGKYLHAHNPWSSNKNLQNLTADLPSIVQHAKGLIHLHARFIRTPTFNGVWIIEAQSASPRVITAIANGPYVVQTS
jgi:hypothetical protein